MDKKTSQRNFKTIKVRISEAESAEIDKRKPEGESMSSWIRQLVMGEEIQIKRKRRKIPVADPKLILHWAKIGGNINQISRALNQANIKGEQIDLIQVLVVLRAIESRIKA